MNLDMLIESNLESKGVDNKKKEKASNVKYKIIDELAMVEAGKNWDIKLALVQWGDNSAKYEIRKWKKDGTAGKGVTFTKEQITKLIEEIKQTEFDL